MVVVTPYKYPPDLDQYGSVNSYTRSTSTGDTTDIAYHVDYDKMFSGAYKKNFIRNEHELVAGQSVWIEKVVYNNPATIVFWSDGTKTVSKCSKNDTYDKEKGLLLCVFQKFVGKQEVSALLAEWCNLPSVASIVAVTDTRCTYCKEIKLADVRRHYKKNK